MRLKTGLDHLPRRHQRGIERASDMIRQMFETWRNAGTQEWRRRCKIYKIILYGSFARNNWVDWAKSHGNYNSDYDLLVIVNNQRISGDKPGETPDFWSNAEDAFSHVSQALPDAEVIVHTRSFVNDALVRGRSFFVDIARQGIALYESQSGGKLKPPGKLSPEIALEEAELHYDEYMRYAADFLYHAKIGTEKSSLRVSIFLLHQAAENAYQCLLLVRTNYSPDIHNLWKLRNMAENYAPSLHKAWPSEFRREQALFNKLKDAYVKARYARHFPVSKEDMEWLIPRVQDLQSRIRRICRARIRKLKQEATDTKGN